MSEHQTGAVGTWAGIERRWLTLIAVCGATFMLLVDITIVQVALPTIQRHLGASFSDLQWVIDAYALAMATLILVWGSSADRFGRKRRLRTRPAVFTVASLLCGVATNSPMLIWSRALQGVGGAALFATGLALIGQEFHGYERGKAIAAWGATVGGAVAVGPLIGGALTSGFGWRSIFFVNVSGRRPDGVAVGDADGQRQRFRHDPTRRGRSRNVLELHVSSRFRSYPGQCIRLDKSDDSHALRGRRRPDGAVRVRRASSATSDVRSFAVSKAVLHGGLDWHVRHRSRHVRDTAVHHVLLCRTTSGIRRCKADLRLLPCTLLCFIVPLACVRLPRNCHPASFSAADSRSQPRVWRL